MQYKAIICDVDGTFMQNDKYGFPSKGVIEAVEKAKDKIHIGLATSRPPFLLENIFSSVMLSSPCIVSSGSQIIDPLTKKVLWEQAILREDVHKVGDIINDPSIYFHVTENGKGVAYSPDITFEKPLDITIQNLSPERAEKFFLEIGKIPTLAVYKASSWEEGKINLSISHASATKQHGIQKVAELLKISTNEIIGVGDGYNDFPLLMACGLKVAMGNAVEELKTIADYIAPSVDDDGVVDVISKYVSQKS